MAPGLARHPRGDQSGHNGPRRHTPRRDRPHRDAARGDAPRRRRMSGWMVGVGNLTALLVVYFAVPVSTKATPAALALGLAATVAALACVGWIIAREIRRLVSGADRGLTGIHLVLLLETVLLVFSLTYYALAVKGVHQMAGIRTRLDALYFAATTMTTVGYGDIRAVGQFARLVVTVNLLFDVVFVAALGGLVKASLGSGKRPKGDGPTRQ